MQQPDTRLALIKEQVCVLTNVEVFKIKNDRKKAFLYKCTKRFVGVKKSLTNDIYKFFNGFILFKITSRTVVNY